MDKQEAKERITQLKGYIEKIKLERARLLEEQRTYRNKIKAIKDVLKYQK